MQSDQDEWARTSDICVAVATPPGQSGLALIRMSGPGSAELMDPLFKPASRRFKPVLEMGGYTCAVGDLVDPEDQEVLDQVVLTCYRAPHSFTGEESIEISCHGGPAVKQSILDLLVRQGARPAEPGEFTKRAFLNGKLDLAQAEAVMDLISAAALRSARNAAAQLRGQLSLRIRQYAQELYRILAGVELVLEFPEHDESGTGTKQLIRDLEKIADQLSQLAASYEKGKILREGLTVVLAGRPNVGKSSLLNALAGYDRAIVTSIPGTTRDTVEAYIDICGLPVRLVDTAGLRDTTDQIEQMGVDRTKQALEQADLVFWLLSPPAEQLESEIEMVRQMNCEDLILLVSKDDLSSSVDLLLQLKELKPCQPIMTCSAVTGEGLDRIREAIVAVYERQGIGQQEDVLITNSRHRMCLEKAAAAVREAQKGLQAGMTLDIAASLLRHALVSLAELTGDQVTEELIDTIFSRFCIGK